jgi:hypothetical protein
MLALDEEKGNILPFARKSIASGLAGGILAELALRGKICSNEKHRLELTDASPTGHEILDETIQEIQAAEKPRKLAYWVSALSDNPKKLRRRTGEYLAARNLLSQEEKRLFWRSASASDEQPFAPPKYEIKNPLRAMILSTEESDPDNLALLVVASASGLLNLIFTEDELPVAARRIHEKTVRAALENPAMQTVEEIGQAVVSSLEDDED